MPFRMPLGTLGGHIRSRVVAQLGSYSRVIQYLIWKPSVAILRWFGMDYTHLTCDLSGAFARILDICHMLGSLVVSDHGVRSLPQLLIVDSSVGVLVIT
jgi:hypothetical protein